MDPSGDDMDRDLCKRIKDISAKLNVDRFLATKFVSLTIRREPQERIT